MSGKRALYSTTGRYVVVQSQIEWRSELESYGVPGIPVTRYQKTKARLNQCLLQDAIALVSPLSRAITGA